MKKKAMMTGLLGVLALLFAACSAQEEGSGVTVQPVSVIATVSGAGQNRFSGKAVSPNTQKVSKEENRTVKEVLVSAGDEVHAGDVLFRYDVDEAKLNIEQAKLEVERSKNSIETLKSQIETLKKEKEKAKSSEQLGYTLQIQSLEVEIKQTEYNISAKEVEIERLEKDAESVDVVSEIDGIIQSISENGYDNYGNPQPYMTIVQVGNYRIEGKIAETNMSAIYTGMPVTVRSRVNEDQTWSGMIDSIDTENNANENQMGYYEGGQGQSATKYPFYVSLENSEGLMMGQHVFIELGEAAGRAAGIWLYPQFIRMEGDKAYVWAANEQDEIEKREITVAETDEATGEVRVAEGLAVTDYIAADSEEIKEGMKATRFDENDFQGGGMTVPENFGGEGMPMEEQFGDDVNVDEEGGFGEGGNFEEGGFGEGDGMEEGGFAEDESFEEDGLGDDAADGGPKG